MYTAVYLIQICWHTYEILDMADYKIHELYIHVLANATRIDKAQSEGTVSKDI